MSRAELIGLIQADAKFIDEGEELVAYINSLDISKPHTAQGISEEYAQYKTEKTAAELATIAAKHKLQATALQNFVNTTIQRMILDEDALTDLFVPLGLGWKARGKAKEALMADLIPLLHKLAQGLEISGLAAYE